MSTSGTQILISKYYFPLKGSGLLGEMVDLGARVRKVQDELREIVDSRARVGKTQGELRTSCFRK